MPDIVNFNVTGPGLFIEVIDSGGDIEIDLVEVYSEWKDWTRLSDNLKFAPAFRQAGADPISASQNTGATFFLNTGAGWRIRPSERDHLLTIKGNMFTDPEDQNPIAPTLGAFTVLVREFVSNVVDSPPLTLASLVDGTLSVGDTLTYLLAMAAGEFTVATISSTIKEFTFQDRASASLYRLRLEKDVGRTRTLG